MSAWPDSVEFPGAIGLLHWDPATNKREWELAYTSWPPTELKTALPLYVIKVCALAIHRDELQLTEREQADAGFDFKYPGYEFSGYVVSTSHYSPLPPGTAVYGRTSFKDSGNARTYTIAKFHELAPKPDCMTWEEAASVPMGSLVAYQALFWHRLLREPVSEDWLRPSWVTESNQSMTILITGAATPVGVWAVQLAKLAGAGRIVATCDAEHMFLAAGFGANAVYDWSTEVGSLRAWGTERFDVVLDCMGGRTLTRAWKTVKEGGKILSVAGSAWDARPPVVNPGIQHFDFTVENCPKHLRVIRDLADRGMVQAACAPDDVFDIHDYQDALDVLSDHPRGQVVLRLDQEYPRDEINLLRDHGRQWDSDDFTMCNMQQAEREDPGEEFPFTRWLQTEGSNDPDLAPSTDSELMPPPPLSQARSMLEPDAGSDSS